MRFRRTYRAALLALGIAMAAAHPLRAQPRLITFDDITIPAAGFGDLPTGYQGINWAGFAAFPMSFITSNFTGNTDIVCRSGTQCGYNGGGAINGFGSTTPMTLNGWIRGWNFNSNTGSATSVLIEAMNAAGGIVATQNIVLSGVYQQFTITSLFTMLRFTPQGGAGLSCSGPLNCGYFLLDDITVTPSTTPPGVVPEPSTYALLATGLVGLAAIRRRRARIAG
jgi:hypothetical protein